MDDAPLQGVSSPFDAFAPLLAYVPLAQIVPVLFALLFIFWAVYTAIAAYHLLRYGHGFSVAVPALITHVIVSFLIAIFAVSGLHA